MQSQPDFLFGVPNSIHQMSNKKFFFYGLLLTACGVGSVLNAALASAVRATKTYHFEQYVNTHWITTLFFFSGVSVILMDRMRKNFHLFMTVILCLTTVPVGFGSFVTDSVNIAVIQGKVNKTLLKQNWIFLGEKQVRGMLVYAGIDLVLALAATVLAILTLWEIRKISCRYFASCDDFQSKWLLFFGTLLAFVCSTKFVLWVQEVIWLRKLGTKARFLFLHYTVDEPAWDAIFVLTGFLTFLVGLRGSRILMYSALTLTAVSAYPAMIYLWIDYRWYSSVQVNKLTINIPKPDNNILDLNLAFGALHLLLILVTIVTQVKILAKAGNPLFEINLNTESSLRKAITFSGILVVCAGFVFLLTDIANLLEKTFFRVFYATEQKLPFYLFVGGILCLLSLRRNVALYFIPSTFTLMLMTIHGTVFHIASYLYLSYANYFGDNLCSLFFWGEKRCTKQVERLGTWAHFFEAAMAVSVFMLVLLAAIVLGRIMRLYTLELGHLTMEEQRKKKVFENLILVVGITTFILGVAVLICSVFTSRHAGLSGHPLIVLHGYIYRSCICLVLVIYPIVQITFAKHLLYFPMRSISLIIISTYRFVEILMQLDYRNLGHGMGMAWTLLCVVEIIDLKLHFITICACASLIDISVNRLPQFDFAGDQVQGENHVTYGVPDFRDDQENVVPGGGYLSFKPMETIRTSSVEQNSEWSDEVDGIVTNSRS